MYLYLILNIQHLVLINEWKGGGGWWETTRIYFFMSDIELLNLLLSILNLDITQTRFNFALNLAYMYINYTLPVIALRASYEGISNSSLFQWGYIT